MFNRLTIVLKEGLLYITCVEAPCYIVIELISKETGFIFPFAGYNSNYKISGLLCIKTYYYLYKEVKLYRYLHASAKGESV
jgi:hypothetical protein